MPDLSWCSARVATGANLNLPEDFAWLAAEGVTAVIDARAEVAGDTVAAPPGMSYLWAPTVDDGQPKPVDYWRPILHFALFILARPGEKVTAHCAGGANRGPSVAFAILVAQGWPPGEAEALIRARRPMVALGYRDSAIEACRALGYV